MERRIIARGLLAGALGGVVAFVFARVFVEPAIAAAIAFEETHSEAGHDHGPELFTRGVQGNIGMGFGVLVFAVAMGALFAVAFVVVYGRIGGLGPRVQSILLAAGAFGAIALVPGLKYPPNPPAVGNEETLGDRTGLYLVMVLLSVLLAIGAVWLGRKLVAQLGTWSASLIAVVAYLAGVTVVMLVLPPIAEVSGDFPASVLYDFRVYSLGTQFVMWTTIAVVFASLTARLLDGQSPTERVPSLTS
jgi:predicted cobalt transporter CbtA